MKTIFKTDLFIGEVHTPPKHVAVPQKTPSPLLINGLPTDSGSLKAQELTGLNFIGEAHTPPIELTFTCLGREWLAQGNRLYHSPSFASLGTEGGEHYQDDLLKPITFTQLLTAVSVSPDGEVPKWALYASTTDAIYEIKFSGTKPVIQRLISTPALGSIGVGRLTRPMEGTEISAGEQFVVFPTAKGIFIATRGGFTPLNALHPNVLEDMSYVHIAIVVDDYGQYLVFLDALRK